MFDFLFLCQFAENDGFQIRPCPYKGHELIIFDGSIIFHGVDVLYFFCSVYYPWAFGLVPSLCYCEHCCSEHFVCMCPYNRTIYNPLDIYLVIGLLGQIEFQFLSP